ncbi:hypothetical protein F5B22DRAFT_650035 [Xylaria bambusicola]|uniref:uncharacterized protein n=1 Tax=Xylaria bambusicola TaxID=326684 RepID=UPI0020087812|nr:uncharacterized protein F5B22DRAFT_650035 [Xylaria bambusicola]KAI0508368.1 hypothetical protein F5B22DRAFT_650035 [Xylaria bambusicola]
MAQKTSDSDDQPNPSSSSTKEIPGSAAAQKQTTSHTSSSPAPAPPNAPTPTPQSSSSTITTTTKPLDFKQSGENAANANTQPMSKSHSAASSTLSKDVMAGPSPYGTRSRNRGQARPNYAEDRDLDVEMEDAFPEKKDEEPKKGVRQTNTTMNGTSDTSKTTASSSRKGAAADDSKVSSSHGSSKDAHSTPTPANATGPATSSGTSKKRKAATQASMNNMHSQASTPTPTPTASAATGTRRGAAQAVAQPSAGYRETNMLSFDKCGGIPKDGKMVADDGTVLEANDHVYLVCEPPGEPYYLGRIMEFLHMQNDPKKPVDALRINWYYRPKDIGKRVNDTRLVFATMHSDISPLTSLRGKCQIRHKAEIEDMDAYRKTPDRFWYEKLYDRYIQKHYDVIPCFQIVNVPEKVKKVLDERWKYIVVEQGRGKEFTSAVKLCKRCNGYCASNDSVDCAVCQQTYHMNCVRPPILKKPSRGFAWACAACSRAQERKLEARHTPSLLDPHHEGEEEELWDEEDDAIDTNRTSPSDGIDDSHKPATEEQMYHASLWPYRYLGQHCKPEDALDYDDRIYPRAGSRLGPKHQATVLPWPGRPVKLVKPIEIKRGSKKDAKATKEALAAAAESEKMRREKRPWIQDEPPGYVPRGEDFDNDDANNTAQLLWKPCDDTTIVPFAGFPKSKHAISTVATKSPINNYLQSAKSKIIPVLGLPKESTNFLDVAINTLFKSNFKYDAALRMLDRTEKSAFKEPELSATEIKKFEEGVTKFGSELYLVSRHVKTAKHARIVRFYYAWKKTERGKQIWGNFSGRKGKKEAKKAEADASKLQDDVADDHDDSAFDTDKALEQKRCFMCKFCATKSSRQWRRAPNSASTILSENGGKGANKEKIQYIVALCRRCAELWRRYAIQWEDMEDLAKKVATAGGRSWKRRVDEELLKELRAAEDMMNMTVYSSTPTRPSPASRATPPTTNAQSTSTDPPPRKKLKTIADKHADQNSGDVATSVPVPPPKKKEKPVEKPLPPPPPPAPELPKLRTLPCAVCNQGTILGEQVICCRECRLTVHRSCYGIPESRNKDKWTCDMCMNDKIPQVSIAHKCILCPVEKREHDFMEPPKNTHKKKTEKDREKERTDRELALKAVELYQKRQVELKRPVNPREPLKRTADNNWVHVTCAIWTPEIKFSSAKALCLSEGIPSIPRARYEEVCKVCKDTGGACVPCHCCRASVHVECAHKSGYLLGFEITPVKGSRRDQHNIVTIGGETGSMSALIWCKEHIPQKTVVHRMHDIVKTDDDQHSHANALQLYVRNFKQADLALTGTVRKANLLNVVTKATSNTVPASQNRRHSSALPCQKRSWIDTEAFALLHQSGDKACITCGIDVSPKWHRIDEAQERILTNGYAGTVGDDVRMFLAQRHFQCHKCKREGRQPAPHVPPQSVERPAEAVEPLRPPPVINPSAAPSSPHHATHAVTRMTTELGNPWPPRPTSSVQPPLPLGQTSLHGPPGGAPQPPPLTAPRTGPSPIAAPGPPPAPAHTYSTPNSSYSEWQRSSAQSSVSSHPITGSSGGPSSVHHNHLRDLRPPPITPMSHHQVPPIQHGLGQPMINGAPLSPRRGPLAVHNGGTPFVSPYHTPTHPPSLHNVTNGGQPSRSDFSQGLLSQRPAFPATPQHRSPPVSHDGVSVNHEPSINTNNSSNAMLTAPRLNDGRPANGASASPSLRNLLI